MKFLTTLLFIFFSALLFVQPAMAQVCDCKEYLYLNETSGDGAIHKFALDEAYDPATQSADMAISNEIGNPWYDNGLAGENVTSPHGLAQDENGCIYVATGGRLDRDNTIRKFTCEGDIIPASEFEIIDAGYNFASADGLLYVPTHDFDTSTPNYVNVYDLCTGDLIGFYCFTGFPDSRDWGFFLDDNGDAYVTVDIASATATGNVPNKLYKFNIYTTTMNPVGSTNPTCTDPLIEEGTSAPVVGSMDFPRDRVFGVTVDMDGNIYVVERSLTGDLDNNGMTSGSSRVFKYDSSGTLLSISPYDTVNGDGGYFFAIGIYYSMSQDLLYVSTASNEMGEDCVALFDTDLNYLGTAVPNPGGGTQAKGLKISKECCISPSVTTIDTLLCDPVTYPIDLSLQDVLGCGNPVCGGMWTTNSISGMTFNDCDNSITITEDNACGTFTYASDGTDPNAQCGAFSIMVNIESSITPTVNIVGDQTFCPGDALSPLTATVGSTSATLQWQMSTASCAGPWEDVAGATSDSYIPAGLTTTTYYQVAASEPGTCTSESCDNISNCVTVMLGNDCCPDPNCFDIMVIRN